MQQGRDGPDPGRVVPGGPRSPRRGAGGDNPGLLRRVRPPANRSARIRPRPGPRSPARVDGSGARAAPRSQDAGGAMRLFGGLLYVCTNKTTFSLVGKPSKGDVE